MITAFGIIENRTRVLNCVEYEGVINWFSFGFLLGDARASHSFIHSLIDSFIPSRLPDDLSDVFSKTNGCRPGRARQYDGEWKNGKRHGKGRRGNATLRSADRHGVLTAQAV